MSYKQSADVAARAQEDVYEYPEKDPALSVLAFVTADRALLVPEFYGWLVENRVDGEGLQAALNRWEVQRFRTTLYTSAHGVLWHYVRAAQAPGQKERQPKLQPGLNSKQRKEKMMDALEKLVEKKAMPGAKEEPQEREPGCDDE